MGVDIDVIIELYSNGKFIKRHVENCNMYTGNFNSVINVPPGLDQVLLKWRHEYDDDTLESSSEEEEEENPTKKPELEDTHQ